MKTAGILALTVATVFAQGSYNDIYGIYELTYRIS